MLDYWKDFDVAKGEAMIVCSEWSLNEDISRKRLGRRKGHFDKLTEYILIISPENHFQIRTVSRAAIFLQTLKPIIIICKLCRVPDFSCYHVPFPLMVILIIGDYKDLIIRNRMISFLNLRSYLVLAKVETKFQFLSFRK